MTAVFGLTCGCPECSPIVVSESAILAPNRWQDSTRVGRMTLSCRLEEALEETEISSQREGTALVVVAGTGLGMSTGWFLTSTSGHILAKATVAGRANAAGGQGRPPHVGGMVGTGDGALTLTVMDGGARVWMTRDSGEFLCPSSPLPAFLAFTTPFCVFGSPSN